MLLSNGLGNILQNGSNLNASYVKKVVRLRLHDQYCQTFNDKLHKFKTLQSCKQQEIYGCSKYLDKINNVKLRNIFTKLRLDCNRLNAYSHSDKTDCDHCHVPETVSHMLFTCNLPKFKSVRDSFLSQMEEKSPIFAAMSITDKLPHILNLDFDNEEVIKLSCSFVKNIYNLRFNRKEPVTQ